MSIKYVGGCLCGAVRYETAADPAFTGNCHCKDCQRASGGPFTPAMFFPAAAVTISGTTKSYRSVADSGNTIDRHFCPECGSQLFTRLGAMPELIGLRAGTLDDASLFKPAIDIYVASAAQWDFMDPKLPKFATYPPPR
ncbi:MAG TPA: GFA family protein [Candidatus Acidoferrum sp.]|nr:GFA family protein [Candidatus Acidoferrum sp.]